MRSRRVGTGVLSRAAPVPSTAILSRTPPSAPAWRSHEPRNGRCGRAGASRGVSAWLQEAGWAVGRNAHIDMRTPTRLLLGIAKRVRRLDLVKHWPECPAGGDISDWLRPRHPPADTHAL